MHRVIVSQISQNKGRSSPTLRHNLHQRRSGSNHGSKEDLDLVPNKVQRKDNLMLSKPVTLEEIKSALEDMEEDKAPGPYGFTARECFKPI